MNNRRYKWVGLRILGIDTIQLVKRGKDIKQRKRKINK